MPRFKLTQPDQMILLPTTIDRLVDQEHLARKIKSILELLSLEEFIKDYHNDQAGSLAYDPKYLINILFYAYATGVRSSRQIEKKCKEDLAYIYLSDFQQPDHTTIARFKVEHDAALKAIFTQTAFMGIESGLIDFKHIASDGTKINGMGSRKQIIDGDKIEGKIEKIEQLITNLVDRGKEADNNEVIENIKKKSRVLEKKLCKLKAAQERYNIVKSKLSKGKKYREHLTEPDAKLMIDKDGYHSGYNCQISVDSKTQMILDNRVTQSENDSHEGLITRERLLEKYGEHLKGSILSFDNGYNNIELIKQDGLDDIEILVSQGREYKQNKNTVTDNGLKYDKEEDVFICMAGNKLKFVKEHRAWNKLFRTYTLNGCSNCEMNDKCFKQKIKNKSRKRKTMQVDKIQVQELKEKYREKMKEARAVEEYNKRKIVAELPFSHITHIRGCDRFSVWGNSNSSTEFLLMCTVHNLLKLLIYSNIKYLAKR